MLTSSLDQQRVQEELRLSEARFRAAIMAVRGVLWTNNAGRQDGWRAGRLGGYHGTVSVRISGTRLGRRRPSRRCAVLRRGMAGGCAGEANLLRGSPRALARRHLPPLCDQGCADLRRRRARSANGSACTPTSPSSAKLRRSCASPTMKCNATPYIVSHDLRAPLVSVSGFAGELSSVQSDIREALAAHPEGARIDADLDEALGFIKASVSRMERLIAAILKLSRDGRRSFRAEDIDMVTVMQGLVDAQRHQVEVVGAQVSVASDLPSIEADRLAVEQDLRQPRRQCREIPRREAGRSHRNIRACRGWRLRAVQRRRQRPWHRGARLRPDL